MIALDETNTNDLEYMALSMADEIQVARQYSPEVEGMDPHIMKKLTRSVNYKAEEDETLGNAWMNISLDDTIGADQTKNFFLKRIIKEDYTRNVPVPSNRTQGSLAHWWSVIQHGFIVLMQVVVVIIWVCDSY